MLETILINPVLISLHIITIFDMGHHHTRYTVSMQNYFLIIINGRETAT